MFWVRVYVYVFNDIILYYYSTSARILTFGYINWTPDVALIRSFFNVVFGRYFRQVMREKLPPKMQYESVITCFCSEILPMVSYTFRENERLKCEIKVTIGYYSVFY